MDIAIKPIKSSPYKLVVTKLPEGGQVLGIFDNGKYIEHKNFKEKHIAVAMQYVAGEIVNG